MQFGTGPDLAAQCAVAPTPDGWRPWTDADGPVPDALSSRAQAIAVDATIPLGTTESYPLPGVTTLLRIEPHAWGRDASGALVQGCFRSTGIYLPEATGPGGTTSTDNLTRTVTILTAVSLVVGIGATLATWHASK